MRTPDHSQPLTGDASPPPASGARAALGLLLLINLFNYLDRYILAAVMPQIEASFLTRPERTGALVGNMMLSFQREFGFTPTLALGGLLSTAFMVSYMISAPLFGRLSERYSRWSLVAVGVAVWSLASGASGLAPTFLALLATRCLVGIGEGAYGPIAPTMIADSYPVQRRGHMLAWFYVAIPVGSAAGYIFGEQVAKSGLGAWGAEILGLPPDGWRWAFYLVTIPGLLLSACALSMRERSAAKSRIESGALSGKRLARWKDYLILLRTPSYVLCTLGMTCGTFAMGGIAVWIPYYLEHKPGVHSYPTTTFGGVLLVTGLLGTIVGSLVADRLRRRFRGSYLSVSGIAMILGFPFALGVTYAESRWIWLAIFMACLCLFFSTGPTNTVLANVTHPAIRASGFAINIFVIHALGDVPSPFVIGLISDRYSMDIAFRVVAVVFLASGLFWLWGARYLHADTISVLDTGTSGPPQ